MSKFKLAATLAVWLGLPQIVWADVAIISTGLPPSHMMPTLAIKGEIKPGDAKTLAGYLPNLEANSRKIALPPTGTPLVIVDLNSLGGDALEAQQIGRLIRSHFLYTRVSAGSTCASACVFILAAGVDRTVVMPALIGLHRPFFDPIYFAGLGAGPAMQKYDSMLADVRHYLADMGMPDDLFRAMESIASEDARFLTEQEISLYGLNGQDAAWEEFKRASRIKVLGAAWEAQVRHCEQTASSSWARMMACMSSQ